MTKVFKIKNMAIFRIFIIFCLVSALPLLSIYELVSTGSIDMESVGAGRFQQYTWKSYLFGWVILLYMGYILLIPFIKCMIRGHIFIVSGQIIKIGKYEMSYDGIENIRRRPFCNDYVICGGGSSIRVHLNFNPMAKDYFLEKFQNLIK